MTRDEAGGPVVPPAAVSKVRVYECVCGAEAIRGRVRPPAPCDRCGSPLAGRPWRLEDARLLLRRLVRRAVKGGDADG